MLNRVYTIPVMLGMFLGVILAGVHISATALGTAIGDHGAVRLMAIESKDGDSKGVRLLGRELEIDVPFEGETRDFDLVVTEKLEKVCLAARQTGGSCMEKGGAAIYDFIRRCQAEVSKIRQILF